jgi:hypothetical protein
MDKRWHLQLYPGAPYASEWPEMPRERFTSEPEARAAALNFSRSWSAGGYNEEDDTYWAREDVDDLHRLTKFTVERTDADAR